MINLVSVKSIPLNHTSLIYIPEQVKLDSDQYIVDPWTTLGLKAQTPPHGQKSSYNFWSPQIVQIAYYNRVRAKKGECAHLSAKSPCFLSHMEQDNRP